MELADRSYESPSGLSSVFKNANWFPGGEAVENVGAEVYSVRPDNCSRLIVDLNLAEKFYVLQRRENAPRPTIRSLKSSSLVVPSVKVSAKR